MAFASWLIGFALLHGQTTGTTTMATNATSQPVADTGQVPPGAVMRLGGDQKELQPYRVKVNNKEYNFADLLKLKPADTAGAQVEITVPFSFKHPGTLNDLDELNFIKQKIAAGAEPWASAFLRLKNSKFANPNYPDKMKQPPAVISSGISGRGAVGAFEEMDAANAAYAQALMFFFTGDKTFARNGEKILETYAATVTSHEGQAWYLLVSWTGAIFPMAADLLHATDPDWKNDRVIAKWFNDVFLPPLHNRIAFGNRELAVINAMGAIGVYNEDPAAFYEALNHWVNCVPAYYYLTDDGPAPKVPDYWTPEVTPSDEFLTTLDAPTFPKDWTSWIAQSRENFSVDKRRGKLGDDITYMTKSVNAKDPGIVWTGAPGTYVNGYCAENSRDLGHVEVAFDSAMNLAEIAWNQGIDVYTPAAKRLTTFMEVFASLRLGEPPPASVTTPLHPMAMGDIYEIPYNHYHNLMGIDLPNTQKILETVFIPAAGARIDPVAPGDAGHDPANPRLYKFPAPYPSLFAFHIAGDDVWLAAFQPLTHRDLNAH